jgi:hypothetical protein
MKKVLLIIIYSAFMLSWGFQKIELEKRSILKGKVEIILPKQFNLMPEEMLKLKYPTDRRPTIVYSNETGTVNIAFNHTASKATQEQIEVYKNTFISTFKASYPTAEWKSTGVKQINGKKVGFIELVTPAIDTKIYNFMFFTNFEGRLLLCSFNCTVEQQSAWVEAAQKISNSLTIK